MTNPKQIQAYAPELAAIYARIDNLNLEAKDFLASAKDAGVNVKALSKAAKEINMDAEKRAKKYEDEAQADLFRFHLGLLDEQGDKATAIAQKVREEKFVDATKNIDALTGGNVSGDYLKIRAKLRSDEIAVLRSAAE